MVKNYILLKQTTQQTKTNKQSIMNDVSILNLFFSVPSIRRYLKFINARVNLVDFFFSFLNLEFSGCDSMTSFHISIHLYSSSNCI